ncbi:nucleoside-diphosphate-sugar epimerase [Naematelia encephala]|uniref:Nucleoside-diphosphate-sugar epimerase n=1 Tax=Naematelia encephala TaxID=71784 RepID=A0A1Y2AQF3_9TREE|nr:nucleoside-diphosphate-sugar epimerase [Naematelia encephala]
MGKRIVFTGGSGKAGRHAIPYLLAQGHTVLNLDLIPLDNPDVFTLKTDLADSGQVFNALSSLFSMSEYSLPERHGRPDAVIHFAAYARNMLVPDNELFASNVKQTYNVVEAACKLGIPKVIIASSETVYGVCFTQGDSDFHSFPLDEDTYDCDPEDSYACSKLCGERIARTFARRYKTDIYALRIGNVIEPHEYALNFPTYLADPPSRKRCAWSYIDARDLGQICHRAVLRDGLGFQVFNATNDTITLNEKTKDFLGKESPHVKITRELEDYEAPLTNKKIRDVLGFKEEHNWRQYVK